MELREVGKKELIVSSTKKLILEKGYTNISVEDITREAGIAKGSFYTYFKSKNLVIDFILNEILGNIGKKFVIDKRLSLANTIKKTVNARLKLTDEEIEDHILLVNLFRNIGLLDSETLELLKKIDNLVVDTIENIIVSYSKNIKIKDKDIRFYSRMLNNMIANYKTFNLFYSEGSNQFIRDIEEVKRKYQTEDFEKNVNIISESILKILTY